MMLANEPVETEPSEIEELGDGGEDQENDVGDQQPEDDLAGEFFVKRERLRCWSRG